MVPNGHFMSNFVVPHQKTNGRVMRTQLKHFKCKWFTSRHSNWARNRLASKILLTLINLNRIRFLLISLDAGGCLSYSLRFWRAKSLYFHLVIVSRASEGVETRNWTSNVKISSILSKNSLLEAYFMHTFFLHKGLFSLKYTCLTSSLTFFNMWAMALVFFCLIL